MIRLFEFRDLDEIMEIWLEGNLQAHGFIDGEYWRKSFEPVRSVLPNAEVYVDEEAGEIRGFIGIDADYIAGLFVKEKYRGQGIGRRLVAAVKQKKRLSLHVYEKNTKAAAFYRAMGFEVTECLTEKETREKEYLMVFSGAE